MVVLLRAVSKKTDHRYNIKKFNPLIFPALLFHQWVLTKSIRPFSSGFLVNVPFKAQDVICSCSVISFEDQSNSVAWSKPVDIPRHINTADQNAGKPLCIRRYTTQHCHEASRAKDFRRNFRGLLLGCHGLPSLKMELVFFFFFFFFLSSPERNCKSCAILPASKSPQC